MKKNFIVLLLVLGFCSFAYADLTDGVLVRYDFDTDLSDSSPNGYDGIAVGSPVVSNGVLTLEAESFVDIPLGGDNPFDGSGDYTAAVRFRTTETAGILLSSARGDNNSHSMAIYVYNINNSSGGEVSYDSFNVGEARAEAADGANIFDGQWHTGVVTYDSVNEVILVYLDFVQGGSEGHFNPDIPNIQEDTVRIGGSLNGHPGGWIGFNGFIGDIDFVTVYNRILSLEEMALLPQGLVAKEKARKPNPKNGATDVPRDVVLSWNPGEFANTHDVYLGTIFDNVNDAGRTNPLAVLASQGQIDTTYDPGRLDFGQTYYWRIDEVNAPPDSTIFKSDVWSFTTELIAYPIENVTATASSSGLNQEPENTINGSGLDVNDLNLHSNEVTEMWLSDAAGPQPTWIQYEFDKVYKLHEMWVWNHNGTMEAMVGIGFKDVTIEYSVNGTDYTTLGTTHEFAQGTGAADYEHNTTVDFGGAVVKFVRLTANSNWVGFLPQYGLSEVRFFYIPVQATEPGPDSGATDVDVDLTLGFKAGREAAKHDVYLSTDEQAVIDGTAPVTTVTENSYSTTLDLDSTYYWRVDEVNDTETPTTWQGDIWSLSTQEFRVVDDFELYNDLNPDDPESNRIFNTWIDGYGTTTNGSLVGYDVAPFAEQDIVHGGNQSMPFFYDNSTAGNSEATANVADLQVDQDWTKGAAETLVLWIHGDLNAAAAQLYVKINNTKVMYDGDLSVPMWRQWNIDLASLGINLSNIATLSIGVDGSGSGTLYVDDIALYKSAPAVASEQLWIEAESATTILEPLKTFDDAAASAGKYIGTIEGDGDPYENPPDEATGPGLATYNFTVAGGTYKIWLRVIIPPGNNNSFWVHVPDATYNRTVSDSGWIVMNDIPDSTEWYWKDVFSSDDGGQSVEFTLAPGSHTLLIGHREELALLDAIVITDLLD